METYPSLAAALRDPESDGLRAGLERLLGHFFKDRAPRNSTRVIGQLRTCNGRLEPVLIIDVSATGAQIQIPHRSQIDIDLLCGSTLIVRARIPEGDETLELPIEAVRFSGAEATGQKLGVRFVRVDQEESALLERLSGHTLAHHFGRR